MVLKLNLKAITIVIIIVVSLVCISFLTMKISANATANSGNAIVVTKDSVCVPIIMYHEVKLNDAGKDVITPYEFESDLKYLQKNNYTTITMTQLIDHVYNKTPLPEKPIILTFDDGYLNNYVYVLPLLKKYNMKIVLSIIGKDTDDFTVSNDDNLDYSHVTWNEINTMIRSGLVEIQNHTYNLHTISSARFGCAKNPGESQVHYEKVLTDDIGKLQSEIEFFTGFVPNTFTYPYGKVSSDSVPILKEMGFKATLTCNYGINIINYDPANLFGLMRICRAHNVPIQKAIADGMKTLKYRKTNTIIN